MKHQTKVIEPQILQKIRIVLVNTSHPGNIGAAARAMKNMGISKLTLVDPKDFPSAEAYSRAAGADDILNQAVVVASLEQGIADCCWVVGTSARSRTIDWPVFQPAACVEKCLTYMDQGEVAIVFGRERSGLTNAELEKCNALVHIPTNNDYSSLNVASAVQVLCYEMRLAALKDEPDVVTRRGNKHKYDVPASAEHLESMYQHLYEALDERNFFGTREPDIVMRRLKGMFNRAEVTQREVAILRGIFSAMQGKKF